MECGAIDTNTVTISCRVGVVCMHWIVSQRSPDPPSSPEGVALWWQPSRSGCVNLACHQDLLQAKSFGRIFVFGVLAQSPMRHVLGWQARLIGDNTRPRDNSALAQPCVIFSPRGIVFCLDGSKFIAVRQIPHTIRIKQQGGREPRREV